MINDKTNSFEMKSFLDSILIVLNYERERQNNENVPSLQFHHNPIHLDND